eukprot:6174131-Pleurochrysis_carterae.AAC.4
MHGGNKAHSLCVARAARFRIRARAKRFLLRACLRGCSPHDILLARAPHFAQYVSAASSNGRKRDAQPLPIQHFASLSSPHVEEHPCRDGETPAVRPPFCLPFRSAQARGLRRRADRRLGDARHAGAVPHVHVARRVASAAARRQRRPASHSQGRRRRMCQRRAAPTAEGQGAPVLLLRVLRRRRAEGLRSLFLRARCVWDVVAAGGDECCLDEVNNPGRQLMPWAAADTRVGSGVRLSAKLKERVGSEGFGTESRGEGTYAQGCRPQSCNGPKRGISSVVTFWTRSRACIRACS